MTNKPILGIDLGTYNSAAAVLKPNGEIEAISATPDRRLWGKSNERIKPFPSIVVYSEDGNVRAVGHEAKALAETEPRFAVWGVKRLLGKTYKEAAEHGELDRMLLTVEPDGNNGRCIFEFGAKELRPEDVCAELLRYIRAAAEQTMKTVFPDVVISVPAYFDAIAISATVEAAKLAGFAHVDTIPEPVAAALTYDLQVSPRPLNFLVFDLGAGTLDVTAAEVWRSKEGPSGLQCQCKKNTGDRHLGGLDMDDRLLQHVADAMKIGNLGDENRLQLRRAVEAAKIRLSTEADTIIEITVAGQQKTYQLSRFELEQSLRSEPKDLLAACEDQVRLALKGADWRPEEVDRLLLIGGPTAMPCVRNTIEAVFHRNPSVLSQIRQSDPQPGQVSVDPMLAVAIGAAKSKGAQIRKVHPYGYGYVNVRLEPVAGQPMWRVHDEPAILLPRDSAFPSEPVVVMPSNPFYRRDKIFSIKVIQHVPDAEQNVPSVGKRPYWFLGEYQLAFTGESFEMEIAMRLTENGELETTIRNLRGSESVTYVGVGSLRRHPTELPASRLEPIPISPIDISGGPDPRWEFVAKNAPEIKNWGEGFSRFLGAKVSTTERRDRPLDDYSDNLQCAITRWGGHLQKDVNDVFNAGKQALSRAHEIKFISEADRHRWEDELDAIRRRCYRPRKQE
ncbi:MAG: Hsp70 family protein [Verrucomicrobia bacterium]|nr:Hsp70 family protein [Verrucomicrobiota bacterium]